MMRLGFGCMRLPMIGEEVDIEQTCQMVDKYLEAGFNYFDTAHGYIRGKSETAIREALSKRYPREKFILTDKLSGNFWSKREDIAPLIDEQLAACGVEYFDYLLMHGLGKDGYRSYVEKGAFEEAKELIAKGKIRHMGISFHDKADVLDMILTEQPQIEVVQIQFNYRDFDDDGVQAGLCYEVCRKHGKPIIVMEPVRGGSLVHHLPEEAKAVLNGLKGGSLASYALRYCASFDGMMSILSGMSSLEQMEDNIATMKDFQPLTEKEKEAIARVVEILRNQNQIPCTKCQYCTERCPMNIDIPALFSMENAQREFPGTDVSWRFANATKDHAKPSECIACGACEEACPQHIEIRDLLRDIAAKNEK